MTDETSDDIIRIDGMIWDWRRCSKCRQKYLAPLCRSRMWCGVCIIGKHYLPRAITQHDSDEVRGRT